MKIDQRIESGMNRGKKGLADLLKSPRSRFDTKPIVMPQAPGIYLVYEGDEPIYLGSSVNIRRRVFSQLFRNRSHYFAYEMVDQRFHSIDKFQDYLTSRCTVQWLVTDGETEAHWLERFVAGVLRPIYNGGSDAFKHRR